MKFSFLFILLLFSSVASYSQYEGTYSLHSTWVFRSVHIQSNNRFSYYYFDCSSEQSGIGWYKISKRKLFLHFEKDTFQKRIDTGKVDLKANPSVDRYFCKIEIKIMDKDSQPIIGAVILDSADNRGTTTDIDGRAILKIPRSRANNTLRVSYVEFNKIIIPLSMESDYKLNIIAAKMDRRTSIPSGQIYTLKIKHKARKSFDLVPNRKFEKYSKALDGQTFVVKNMK